MFPLAIFLLQLESLKSDTAVQQPEVSKGPQPSEVNDHLDKSVPSKIEDADESDGGIDVKVDTEEIVKELKRVRRQNSITHWLLSFVIVLTVAWQISEVSLLWKVKNGLSHPFRHLGGMFTGMLRDPVMKVQDEEEEKNQQLEALSLPSFKMPELPYMDLTELSRSEHKH